jgi:hypothetical protein
MEYVNKSGVAALRGIHRTGRLDDSGLPELAWYGATVDGLTAGSIIGAMLDAIGYSELDPAEQAAILGIVTDGTKPFQRAAIRRIVRGHR